MPYMGKEEKYFLYVISCAFNGTKPDFWDDINCDKFLCLSKEHQMFSTIYPLVSDIDGFPREQLDNFRNLYMNYLRQTLVLSNEKNAVFSELSRRKIRYMPLKGSILKRYYPKESMRQMGDIDLLYDSQFRDEVEKIMSQRGYTNFSSGENSDDYSNKSNCIFEFHRTLFFKESKFNFTFDNLWENATVNNDNPCEYLMDINNLYLHSVCHMYKHYMYGGCGIRFLADIYLMLRQDNNNLDWDFINEKLNDYNILNFEIKSKELAFAIFEQNELTQSQLNFLNTFLTFGIFGNEENRVTFKVNEYAKGRKIDSAVTKRYMFYRLFPPKKKMYEDYRYLEKHKYLLPVYYLYRMIRAAVNFRKTKAEIKYISKTKE